jgi:hypothetical protein
LNPPAFGKSKVRINTITPSFLIENTYKYLYLCCLVQAHIYCMCAQFSPVFTVKNIGEAGGMLIGGVVSDRKAVTAGVRCQGPISLDWLQAHCLHQPDHMIITSNDLGGNYVDLDFSATLRLDTYL